jgi:geranylgeranyl reductase family protein
MTVKSGIGAQPDAADVAGPWDVVVVGAGPAGAIAGRTLALAGHRVLLVDRRRFPRDKACGDALIPDALAVLTRHGLLGRVEARAKRWDRASVFGPLRTSVDLDAQMLTIRREVLDAELAAAAIEAGATLGQGLVTDVIDGGERGAAVTLSTGQRIDARLVCIATGANVTLLERCGLLTRPEPSAVAVRAYVESSCTIDRPIVSFDRRILPGYGWIFPMGGGAYNVGCGVVERSRRAAEIDLRAMLDAFLDALPLGRALVRGERRRTAARGAMLRYGLTGARPYSGGSVIAVGETIGSTFPLTGEGIGKAMETAELGAALADEALRAGTTEPLVTFAERLRTELRPRYAAYETAERWVGVPGVTDLLFLRARRRPRLRAAFTGVLHETLDPSRYLTLGGVLRALTA